MKLLEADYQFEDFMDIVMNIVIFMKEPVIKLCTVLHICCAQQLLYIKLHIKYENLSTN